MPQTASCTFCNIVGRKAPAEVLYENDVALAILDVRPIHFGHSLIIPREHCSSFLELSPESFSGVLEASQRVARALVKALDLEGFNIFSNNGRVAGQSVFHFHFHVVPRYPNDSIRFTLDLKSYGDGEREACAQRLRALLQR